MPAEAGSVKSENHQYLLILTFLQIIDLGICGIIPSLYVAFFHLDLGVSPQDFGETPMARINKLKY
ncbi:hypothetical protein [Methylobacterium sp. Leaf100]|uniref:hypothetical protein n=1 Tax=Methylobacterium sp. Leaf100 TaxID=1736252 RepID=UPI000A80DD29|nr:hypothetical protein [Methylobacterium sp. Leaf100]